MIAFFCSHHSKASPNPAPPNDSAVSKEMLEWVKAHPEKTKPVKKDGSFSFSIADPGPMGGQGPNPLLQQKPEPMNNGPSSQPQAYGFGAHEVQVPNVMASPYPAVKGTQVAFNPSSNNMNWQAPNSMPNLGQGIHSFYSDPPPMMMGQGPFSNNNPVVMSYLNPNQPYMLGPQKIPPGPASDFMAYHQNQMNPTQTDFMPPQKGTFDEYAALGLTAFSPNSSIQGLPNGMCAHGVAGWDLLLNVLRAIMASREIPRDILARFKPSLSEVASLVGAAGCEGLGEPYASSFWTCILAFIKAIPYQERIRTLMAMKKKQQTFRFNTVPATINELVHEALPENAKFSFDGMDMALDGSVINFEQLTSIFSMLTFTPYLRSLKISNLKESKAHSREQIQEVADSLAVLGAAIKELETFELTNSDSSASFVLERLVPSEWEKLMKVSFRGRVEKVFYAFASS